MFNLYKLFLALSMVIFLTAAMPNSKAAESGMNPVLDGEMNFDSTADNGEVVIEETKDEFVPMG